MSIKSKLNKFNILCFNSGIGIVRKPAIFIDSLIARYTEGAGIEEYFRNEFYNLNSKARKNYYTIGRKRKAQKILNNPQLIEEIDNKIKFNKNFKDYLGREWIDLAMCTESEFLTFSEKHPKCFVKESNGLQGIGADNPDFRITDPLEYYLMHREDKLIVEEQIVQCRTMADFNESTVNTIRVLTVRNKNGDVIIPAAALRVGRSGEITDNFHNHGIAANIDVKTGIVFTEGVDKDFRRFVVHPDSGKPITGFKVPRWKEICELVTKAASIVPEVRYVGWDIAIGNENLQLIEGNSTACPDVLEMPCRQGLWKTLKDLC